MDKQELKHLPRIGFKIFDKFPKRVVELVEIVIEIEDEIHPRGESFADAVTNAHGTAKYDVKKCVYVAGISKEETSLIFGNECINENNNVAEEHSKKLSEIKSYRVLEKLG